MRLTVSNNFLVHFNKKLLERKDVVIIETMYNFLIVTLENQKISESIGAEACCSMMDVISNVPSKLINPPERAIEMDVGNESLISSFTHVASKESPVKAMGTSPTANKCYSKPTPEIWGNP